MTIHLIKEINNLKKMILGLGATVEEKVRDAVAAVVNGDAALASKIIEGDAEIDRLEVRIEEECLKILALHQPVAVDLRYIVAILKINSDLERIADLAVNIAERAEVLAGANFKKNPAFAGFDQIVHKTQTMLKMSLDSLINMDVDVAGKVLVADDEIDALNRDAHAIIGKMIEEHPADYQVLSNFLDVFRRMERIADQVTNIAEDVIYMCEGKIVRHRNE